MSPSILFVGVVAIAILAIAIGSVSQLSIEKYQTMKKLARKRKSASALKDVTNVLFC